MHRPIPEDLSRELFLSPRALTPDEVEQRRARYGRNDILDTSSHPLRALALDTAKDPMLWFLIGASALYGFLGESAECLTLLISTVPLVGMDAFLHRRTQASTEGLRSQLASRATVLRGPSAIDVAVEDVVPGDLVLISVGQHFPADGILVEGEELQSDESTLTGEAYPVRKRALGGLTPRTASRAEDVHWGFAGTRLLTGRATLRVVWTGETTLYGEIVRSARSSTRARTPLQRNVGQLVRVLLIAATLLCATLAIVRVRQGFGWSDALLSALTLAVAAIPEEFPVLLTMFLGVGVHRLARQKALVRRAVSVENIGRVSCICSDKTGTLTMGELTLTHWLPHSSQSDASTLQRAAALASRRESGDPLDEAIFRALDSGAKPAPDIEVIAAYPFTEDRRRETAIARTATGLQIATKGAPETIFSLCAIAEPERIEWIRRANELASAGHKVIACATRSVRDDAWLGGEPDRDFELSGLLALEDPIREGVPEAIGRCQAAGIRVVMVTGDHPGTAVAVAGQLGLGKGTPRVILGEQLDASSEADRVATLVGVDVVARAIPAQKLAIVRAFQADGEIVAVTGDGVNDVPALQAADIGIAMGERATRSAREMAAIVLLDDNFTTLVRAIAEGRQLFKNLQRSFQYLLLVHIPLVVTAALIPLAGYPILYLPIHIVWLELLIHPSALLAFQEPAPDGPLGERRGRPYDAFFSRREWGVIAFVGTAVVGMLTYGFHQSLGTPPHVEHARAMVLALLSISSAGFVATLSGLRTGMARWIVGLTLAFSGLLIQTPWLSMRLHMQPLHLTDWGLALAGGAAACLPLILDARLRRPINARETAFGEGSE